MRQSYKRAWSAALIYLSQNPNPPLSQSSVKSDCQRQGSATSLLWIGKGCRLLSRLNSPVIRSPDGKSLLKHSIMWQTSRP